MAIISRQHQQRSGWRHQHVSENKENSWHRQRNGENENVGSNVGMLSKYMCKRHQKYVGIGNSIDNGGMAKAAAKIESNKAKGIRKRKA